MKKLLRSTVMLAVMSCLLFFSCTPEESETACNCEEATYIEEKYQEETNNSWLLNRVETSRVNTSCQSETDFIRTGNGTEVKRIECN